ncbi:NAD(P)/FAD-dependent oxidoreductase [bacterium]|nr:NAD(P)/FAD-dependent oxidoreductase [bacterium]
MSDDAIVVGSGPNGLAAAITLARAGLAVRVLEASERVGGGLRSEPLTLPGFVHDPCSEVFPMGIASPFFRSLPQQSLGVEWVHGQAPLVHALPGGRAVTVHHSLEATAAELGPAADAYRGLVQPTADNWRDLLDSLLGPPFRVPRHPIAMARFGLAGICSSAMVARRFESDEGAHALWAGVAAHLASPLNRPLSAAPALMLLGAAHTTGWPVARGGTGSLTKALVSYLESLGSSVETGRPVRTFSDLPPARATVFDTSPRQLLAILGDRLHGRYRRQLESYRRGAALFKVDYALAGPVPWRASACRLAPTVHLADSYASVAESEATIARGGVPARPFIIVAQPSLFDPTRAPAGKHTLWAYCHIPNGCPVNMTEVIEARIEEVAPGFRDLVLARASRGPADLEHENPNFDGGDFSNGAMDGMQTLFRPALRWDPYATPVTGVSICSAATPPGPGIHGMCGYWAGRSALRRLGIEPGPLRDSPTW